MAGLNGYSRNQTKGKPVLFIDELTITKVQLLNLKIHLIF